MEVPFRACLVLSDRLLVAMFVDPLKCQYSVIMLDCPDEKRTVNACCQDTLLVPPQDLIPRDVV
jgi:hypothetical protein